MSEAEQAPVEVTPESKPEEKQRTHEEVAEEAAIAYQGMLPFVKKLGNALSGQKSVVRVLYAFMANGLETNNPKLLNRAEKQFFQLLQDIAASKAYLMNKYAADLMEQKMSEQQQAADEANVEQSV